MCLSLISDQYFSFDLLSECISVVIADGKLLTQEVYDIFFTAADDCDNLRLHCLSPHQLISDGTLHVSADPAKDSGEYDKYFYDFQPNEPPRLSDDGEFVLALTDASSYPRPSLQSYKGKLLTGAASVPVHLMSDSNAVNFMNGYGTIFDLELGSVKKGEQYAVRVVVRPIRLLGLSSSRLLPASGVYGISGSYAQDAMIIDPAICHFQFTETLKMAKKKQHNLAAAATAIQSMLSLNGQYLMPIDYHRIVLLLPPSAELYRDHMKGDCTHVSTHTLQPNHSGKRVVMEWAAGRRIFWRNDPEHTAWEIWKYLKRNDGRSVEDVSNSMSIHLKNCELLLPIMRNAGMISPCTDARQFVAADLSKDEALALCKKVTEDTAVYTSFHAAPFSIRFTIQYRFFNSPRLLAIWTIRILHIVATIGGILALTTCLLN